MSTFPTYVSLSPSGISKFKLISVTSSKKLDGELYESAEYYNITADIYVKTEFILGRLVIVSTDPLSDNLVGSQLFPLPSIDV